MIKNSLCSGRSGLKGLWKESLVRSAKDSCAKPEKNRPIDIRNCKKRDTPVVKTSAIHREIRYQMTILGRLIPRYVL